MDTMGLSPDGIDVAEPGPLALMPLAAFVSRWRVITGEPPAIMLESRREMLTLLVQSVPVAPLVPVVINCWGERPLPLHRGIATPAPVAARAASRDGRGIRGPRMPDQRGAART